MKQKMAGRNGSMSSERSDDTMEVFDPNDEPLNLSSDDEEMDTSGADNRDTPLTLAQELYNRIYGNRTPSGADEGARDEPVVTAVDPRLLTLPRDSPYARVPQNDGGD